MPTCPQPNFDAGLPDREPAGYRAIRTPTASPGPGAAAGWAGEATLDIEWAYAIAPKAHIVLLGVPPAETLGRAGLPEPLQGDRAGDRHVPVGHGLLDELRGRRADVRRRRAGADRAVRRRSSSGDREGRHVLRRRPATTARPARRSSRRTAARYVPDVGLAGVEPVRDRGRRHAAPVRLALEPAERRRRSTPTANFNPAYFASTRTRARPNVVWNESWLPAATGGGPSAIYPRPTWQSGVASVVGGDHRGTSRRELERRGQRRRAGRLSRSSPRPTRASTCSAARARRRRRSRR